MNTKTTYQKAYNKTEVYLGYINGKLCKFILCFDVSSHCYKKVAV